MLVQGSYQMPLPPGMDPGLIAEEGEEELGLVAGTGSLQRKVKPSVPLGQHCSDGNGPGGAGAWPPAARPHSHLSQLTPH